MRGGCLVAMVRLCRDAMVVKRRIIGLLDHYRIPVKTEKVEGEGKR